jgi:hypothetical protein
MGVGTSATDWESAVADTRGYVGIKYEDLAYTTAKGFASMGTNNGHNGTTGVTFLNNPDILEDFSYRA